MNETLQRVKINSLVGIVYDMDRLYTRLIYGQFHKGQGPYCRLSEKHKRPFISFFSRQLFYPVKNPKELHDRYCNTKVKDGWKYDKVYDSLFKTDPNLVKYEKLSFAEKLRYVIFINSCEYLKKHFEIEDEVK